MYGKYKPSLAGRTDITPPEVSVLSTEVLIKAKSFDGVSLDIASIKSYELKAFSKSLRFAVSGLVSRLIPSFMTKCFGLAPAGYVITDSETENGPAEISFLYKGCQIDLELVPSENIILAIYLRSGEGMGYVLQKLYSRLGLNLSEKGLFVDVPSEVSGLDRETSLQLSLDRSAILNCVEVGQGLLSGGHSLHSIISDLNFSPYLTEDVLDMFSQEELEKYSELELFQDNMNALRTMISVSSNKMSGVIPIHILRRNAIRIFGCEQRYKQKIIHTKLQRNKENLVNNQKFYSIIGFKLTKSQKEDFIGYYKVVRPRYEEWMASVPETQVIEDIRKEFNSWKAAMDSIYPANSFEAFSETSRVEATSPPSPSEPPLVAVDEVPRVETVLV